jgi:hypothetical protein
MKMKHGFITLTLASLLLLSGCARYMSGSLNSVPDPGYAFDKNAPVLVLVASDSDEPMLAKHFFGNTLTFLRAKGFQRVYTEDNLPNGGVVPKLFVVLDVDKNTRVHEYTSADYGNVATGETTECTTESTKKGEKATCTTKAIMTREIIGYSKKRDYYTERRFLLSMFNSDKKPVLEAQASYFGNQCPQDKIYRFLVTQTFQRIDLRSVVEQEFTVEMPEGTTCG